MTQGIYDREKVTLHIARLKKGGSNFEIDVDFDAAINFKQGKADIGDALKAEKIFSDAKKGMLASETQMKQLFETSEPLDKAGAYAFQGKGRFLISKFSGEEDNIIGLPRKKLKAMLLKIVGTG